MPKELITKPAAKPVHPKAVMTFRRNVMPPIFGILVALVILGVLNSQWLVAQYQYNYTKPVAVTNSTSPIAVDLHAPAMLYIPKINVAAPLVTDQKTYDQSQTQLALRRGVVQYGFSADPGQKGKIVVIGHSSGQLWSPGDYKFVFTQLDKLTRNDRILIDFKGKRYIYRVSSTTTVIPTDTSVLQPSDEPQLTLITCTPVGTSKNRLVVVARQVSPKPETATVITEPLLLPLAASEIPN